MTTHLPPLGDLPPHLARKLLRIQERCNEIVHQYAPTPEDIDKPLSPLATIQIEALAHLLVLQRLHLNGAEHHQAHGNSRQQLLWERDAKILQDLANRLISIKLD